MIVKITMHDNTKYVEEIEDFDLASFIEEINTSSHRMIQFGRVGVIKSGIRKVDTIPDDDIN